MRYQYCVKSEINTGISNPSVYVLFAGEPGDAAAGPSGPKGNPGIPGSKGDTGLPGLPGLEGKLNIQS